MFGMGAIVPVCLRTPKSREQQSLLSERMPGGKREGTRE